MIPAEDRVDAGTVGLLLETGRPGSKCGRIEVPAGDWLDGSAVMTQTTPQVAPKRRGSRPEASAV